MVSPGDDESETLTGLVGKMLLMTGSTVEGEITCNVTKRLRLYYISDDRSYE